MISLSPLRLPSPSFNQNAISSQIAATAVTPRMLLKLAACTLMSMPFTSDETALGCGYTRVTDSARWTEYPPIRVPSYFYSEMALRVSS